MKEKTKICGFLLKETRELSELSCNIYEYEHEKTGARLVYLDREDENKTFAIGFSTPPEDSTGVFHIIEHSVLCGSEKFPVKEPFVELLKSSLNTFLNALTYPDRTVYPVASRCERDYLNLMEVYLDAVFFPLMKTDERVFMQEGVHLEYDKEDDSLSFKGVVYNEMKGAYSAPEEAGFPELDRALYKGTPYEYDSGGCPENIPDLTYEKFVLAHEKYYHPKNSVTVLDGKQDLEKSLALIDSYFSRFEDKNIEICKFEFTKEITPTETVYYDASDEEGEKSKIRLLRQTAFASFDDRCAALAGGIIADVLAGTNDSPLKRELISKGLVEDVTLSVGSSALTTVTVEYRGIRSEDSSKIEEITREVVRKMLLDGVPRAKISASLNRLEFRALEADYGARPRGIALALSAVGNMLRGVPAEAAMSQIPLYKKMRELIDTDFYERVLSKMLLDYDHSSSVLLIPSESFGREIAERESARLAKIRASLDGAALSALLEKQNALILRQEGEDSPEALATLPRLSLSDIPKKPKRLECEKLELDGVGVLSPKVKTDVVYTELYFKLTDLSPEELTLTSLLVALYLNLPTENYDVLSLGDEIKSSLGSFVASSRRIALTDGTGRGLPLFSVSCAALAERWREIPRMLKEVLLTTRLDAERVKTVLRQIVIYAEEGMISSGETLALGAASATVSHSGAVEENFDGYTAYLRFKEYSEILDKNPEKLLNALSALSEKIIRRAGLVISVTGMDPSEMAREIIEFIPEGKMGCDAEIPLLPAREIGYAIPSRVSYAVSGGFLPLSRAMQGAMRVARHILSYDYLWNNIRVLGGAYGAGFVTRKAGEIFCYSYRDPSPERSLEIYKGAPAFLRQIAEGGVDLTDYIIGAVGEYDILISPKLSAQIASDFALIGWSPEDEEEFFAGLVGTDSASLCALADELERLFENAVLAVVGEREKLEKIEGISDNILTI